MGARVKGSGIKWTALALSAALAAGAAAVAFAQGPESAGLTKVRFGGDRFETRVVLELDKETSAKLLADGTLDRRVVLAMPRTTVTGDLQGAGYGLVKAWMVEEAAGGARLSLDLRQDAEVRRRFLLPPSDGATNYRYVIDLRAKGAPAAPLASEAKAALAATPISTASPPPLRLKKVVVIDAGHGGNDPGTSGAHYKEKELVLAAAQSLKTRLERSGKYKVLLTRDTDVYVPREGRVQIARRADADLFISLHADAGPNPSTQGASVYTLSEKGQGRVAEVANKNDWFMNASLSGGDKAVSQILLDLTQRTTKNRSAMFAETLLEKVSGAEIPLLRRSHRDAGFVVLLAPDVPAVLFEMGFMTNPDDEARLSDPASRNRMTSAIGDAIDAYFAQQTRLAAR
ncbi:N-acetylmuramoyl-L-alanine amidase [Caulobacter segnis]|uniref:N-acetylmuramoyl-L-alanine amidase family protein n=1 Tax=Caulobacter segnis TaxID=88688 RepID=UPI00240ED418|nr:N-acetylmuramoyl-L-alanine amidase [Caulobacter segnis]MDG2522317.1 N-acetylmuramoyl-L-alanine amidase [Caulobacter segnis]